jgi:hypothetical protein
MDHRPFEDWLLESKELTNIEKHQLDAHLQSCPSCCALAEVGLALKSVKSVQPSEGFVDRFQFRLAARKKALRRRNFMGFFILSFCVLSLLVWLGWPLLASFIHSPVNLLASWLTSLVSLWAGLQALYQGGLVVFKVLPAFVPAYVWMIILFLAGGWSLLWIFSVLKFTKLPQGVR